MRSGSLRETGAGRDSRGQESTPGPRSLGSHTRAHIVTVLREDGLGELLQSTEGKRQGGCLGSKDDGAWHASILSALRPIAWGPYRGGVSLRCCWASWRPRTSQAECLPEGSRTRPQQPVLVTLDPEPLLPSPQPLANYFLLIPKEPWASL